MNEDQKVKLPAIWFIGPPGAGKSATADMTANLYRSKGVQIHRIDGHELRERHPEFGFSAKDRVRWNKKLATRAAQDLEVGKMIPILSSVLPSEEAREAARSVLGDRLQFIHMTAPEETLRERRRPLYEKKDRGEVEWVEFEPPKDALVVFDTSRSDLVNSAKYIVRAMDGKVQGLGDLIKVVADMTFLGGIKGCRCNLRRLVGNSIFPFRRDCPGCR